MKKDHCIVTRKIIDEYIKNINELIILWINIISDKDNRYIEYRIVNFKINSIVCNYY